jgi:autotransporter-associated beta strand protein
MAVFLRAVLFSFFALVGLVGRGATLVWDFDTGTVGVQQGDGTWTTGATNWWTGSANSTFSAADIASFGGTGAGNVITIGEPVTATGLIFNAGYSLTAASAQTLTLGASGIVVNGASNLATVGDANLSIALLSNQTWSVAGLSGATGTPGLTVAGALSGAFTLTKTDNGMVTLSGNNAGWSGTLAVNAGVVRVTDGTALGTTAATTVANNVGAALQLAGGVSSAEPLTLNNSGINTGGALQALAGAAVTQSGAITLATAATIGADAGATLNVTGGITGAQALTLAGAGNINLTTGALGAVSSLTKLGSGTATLGVASGTFVGPVTVSGGGTLVVGSGGVGQTGGTGAIILEGGGGLTVDNSSGTSVNNRLGSNRAITLRGSRLTYLGGGTASTETFGAVTIDRGFNLVTVTAGAGGAGLALGAVADPTPIQTGTPKGTTALFRGTSLGTVAGANVATITSTAWNFAGQTGATGAVTKGILPWAIVDTSDTGLGISFATADSGTAILRPLTVATETVADFATANANVRLVAAQTLAASGTMNSLTLVAGGGATIGALQSLSLSSGGILALAGNAGISGGIISAPAAGRPLTIHAVGDLMISSLLTGGNGVSAAQVSFVKGGPGVLTLQAPLSPVVGMAATTLTGQTVVTQGTLRLAGGTNTLAPNNYLNVGPGATVDYSRMRPL